MGKSKYETMAEATKEKIETMDESVDDVVEEKRLRAELERIDKEIELEEEDIRNTPINKELLKKQAKTELESSKKTFARTKTASIQDRENEIQLRELDLNTAKNNLSQVKDEAKEIEEKSNLRAQTEYDKVINNVDNTDKTIELKVKKAKAEGKNRKKEIQIKLDSIKARNEIQKKKEESLQNLYNDVRNIGLKFAEGNNKE